MRKILLTLAFTSVISTQAVAYETDKRDNIFNDIATSLHRLADEEKRANDESELRNDLYLLEMICVRYTFKRHKEFCAKLETRIKQDVQSR